MRIHVTLISARKRHLLRFAAERRNSMDCSQWLGNAERDEKDLVVGSPAPTEGSGRRMSKSSYLPAREVHRFQRIGCEVADRAPIRRPEGVVACVRRAGNRLDHIGI